MTISASVGLQPENALGQEAAEWARETFTLKNGMDVVVISDHRAPVVTHMVWYRVGAADEPPGKSGIAHFLEHLMFRGTKNVPPGEMSKIVARNGGQDNAFTSQDYTAYFQRVALDRLPLVMELEADRMTNLVLTDDIVLPERDVILEERSSRVDNDPESKLSEQLSASLYMAHPYGIPIIGWEHEIRLLETQDALDFYAKYYAPNNAILIVAGDITAEQLRPLAEKYYGEIAPRDLPERVRVQEPPAVAARQIDYSDLRVQQASFRRSYLAPSYHTAGPLVGEALDILSHALGSGPTSRFYRQLVVEKGLAASARASYSGTSLDYGRFSLFGSPRPGVDLAALEEGVDEVIVELLKEGITQEELERARSNLIADMIYARDSQRVMAQTFGASLTTGLTVEDVVDYPNRVAKVTVEDVNVAARLIFNSSAQVTGYMRPGSNQ